MDTPLGSGGRAPIPGTALERQNPEQLRRRKRSAAHEELTDEEAGEGGGLFFQSRFKLGFAAVAPRDGDLAQPGVRSGLRLVVAAEEAPQIPEGLRGAHALMILSYSARTSSSPSA